MRKLLLIGRWFRGKKKTVIDLQTYRELKEKQKEAVQRSKSKVQGPKSNDGEAK